MITAVDTNILLDILLPNPLFAESSMEALQAAGNMGALIICDIVYAELCAAFSKQADCDAFLKDARIRIEPIGQPAGFLASRAWLDYRRSGGKRERVLPDFLIGAHASIHASRLLTRDAKFYESRFPSLKITDKS